MRIIIFLIALLFTSNAMAQTALEVIENGKEISRSLFTNSNEDSPSISIFVIYKGKYYRCHIRSLNEQPPAEEAFCMERRIRNMEVMRLWAN